MTEWNGAAGPKVVAIGGGTGLSTMLRGLKSRTRNLTAIVTVADDGGGSGMLRQDLGMPPPGDIRHCMEALANVEPVMEQLPVTNDNVALEATFENGTRVLGESKISAFKKEQDCRIESMRLLPEHPKALPEAVRAIGEADMILLGPGSLYTSVIPNLLVEGIADAVRASKALKIYICNIMTQDGETEGMTAADHVRALLRHSGPGLVDICLCNSAPVRPGLVERYREEDAAPIVVDREAIEALGVELVTRPLASETLNYARHSFTRLANAVMELYNERADTRIF